VKSVHIPHWIEKYVTAVFDMFPPVLVIQIIKWLSVQRVCILLCQLNLKSLKSFMLEREVEYEYLESTSLELGSELSLIL